MKLKIAALTMVFALAGAAVAQRGGSRGVPKFEVNPFWPKPLPNNWMLGQIGGTFVDAHDHLWVTTRPRSLDDHDKYASADPPKADCCVAPPPILEFDPAGNVVQAWGGPNPQYEWPDNEHGVFVDHKENVWITGNGMADTNILKFTRTGKFLLQIGRHGKSGGNSDTGNLNRPAGVAVSPKTNEVFVADGYNNRRVIVFDGDTGAFKRQWGAYGNKPDDNAPRTRVYEGNGSPQFNLLHGIRISTDGLVYVADRVNSRIQVFKLDGTFVKEGYMQRATSSTEGTAFDVAFSPDRQQQFIYVPDGSNKKVHILNRETMAVVGSFGGRGGHGIGEFFHVHSIASDSKNNIYLGESFGRRVTKWSPKG
jgi:hypothetical protein